MSHLWSQIIIDEDTCINLNLRYSKTDRKLDTNSIGWFYLYVLDDVNWGKQAETGREQAEQAELAAPAANCSDRLDRLRPKQKGGRRWMKPGRWPREQKAIWVEWLKVFPVLAERWPTNPMSSIFALKWRLIQWVIWPVGGGRYFILQLMSYKTDCEYRRAFINSISDMI